jgi:hypothetical protein
MMARAMPLNTDSITFKNCEPAGNGAVLTIGRPQRRKEIDRKYHYRYSQLTHVFGKLLYEGRLREEELRGLREDKLKSIRSVAQFLAKYAA